MAINDDDFKELVIALLAKQYALQMTILNSVVELAARVDGVPASDEDIRALRQVALQSSERTFLKTLEDLNDVLGGALSQPPGESQGKEKSKHVWKFFSTGGEA